MISWHEVETKVALCFTKLGSGYQNINFFKVCKSYNVMWKIFVDFYSESKSNY